MIVAIDGPAGAGKSTIARRVAERLNFQLIDTGAIYRTVAWRAVQEQVNLDDASAIAELAASLRFDFTRDARGQNQLICDGRVMGDEIRDRKSTRLNSSHVRISYAVFCLKKKN